ncbi:rhodanese-like protein [Diplodia corticola]|uniref:Rhodanese-like protein n=1 Tax=Diplodia corticola TaxID=236234 RepID=A0A1J9R9P4_9PEZI|nr:rhodanese-like protein [Diplodia corticola]OJD29155.1 rhodanese-like protein [Diplodia corticola]
MASRRALMRISLRSATASCRAASFRLAAAPARAPSAAAVFQPAAAVQKQVTQIRWHSAEHGSKSKVYDFNGIKQLLSNPAPDRVLIDVREPHEFAGGFIPTAHNMPIGSAPEGIFLPADEFEERFGFQKPTAGNEVVFYCKAGVRSSSAAALAQQAGYERVGEYRGSWLDWCKNGGETSEGPK